jgi:hypothetical protein
MRQDAAVPAVAIVAAGLLPVIHHPLERPFLAPLSGRRRSGPSGHGILGDAHARSASVADRIKELRTPSTGMTSCTTRGPPEISDAEHDRLKRDSPPSSRPHPSHHPDSPTPARAGELPRPSPPSPTASPCSLDNAVDEDELREFEARPRAGAGAGPDYV